MPERPERPAGLAFGLPEGSIRALLAVLVTGAICVFLYRAPDHAVPDAMQNLMFVILGHYFASRGGPSAGPAPLHLPSGSVRAILALGLLAVAVLLARQGRLFGGGDGAYTLILALAFVLGVLLARLASAIRRGRPLPRPLANLKALVAVVAAVLLVLALYDLLPFDLGAHSRLLPARRVVELLAGLVGFYFGSRS
jgi:hypothetical protein